MKHKILFVLTFLAFITGLQTLHAHETVREKLKERLAGKSDLLSPEQRHQTLPEKNIHAGDYDFSLPHDGLTRLYHVHIPTAYDKTKPTPLLIALHGGGGDMNYMARDKYYGLISKSDREGFIVAFPNGYSRFKSGKLATWNAGTCCGDARDKNIDDVGFIKKMTATLSAQLNIDPARIYATGMSNGGMMAYRLACELPDIFRAIAAVAGTDNTTQCTSGKQVSILHIHALDDTHVLFNGGAGPGSFKNESKVTDFTSVPDTISRWIRRNNCRPGPERTLSITGAYCDLYSNCSNDTQVKLCVTETGAHSWPGGYKPRGDEPPSKAISASDMMWEFFGHQK